MNQVTITVLVKRENSKQVMIALYREGSGDDMVEQRADLFEKAINDTFRSIPDEIKTIIKDLPPESV